MDLNRLLNMLARMFIRSATDAATRGGKPLSEMTPEERQQAKSAREMAKRFQKTTRLGRRFFR